MPLKSSEILTNSSLVYDKEDKSNQNSIGTYSQSICPTESFGLILMDEETSQKP